MPWQAMGHQCPSESITQVLSHDTRGRDARLESAAQRTANAVDRRFGASSVVLPVCDDLHPSARWLIRSDSTRRPEPHVVEAGLANEPVAGAVVAKYNRSLSSADGVKQALAMLV